jgi:tetratricopeptide (TPR) repeat protein
MLWTPRALVGCVVAVACLAAPQARAAEDSLVGKRIIVTKNGLKLGAAEDQEGEADVAGVVPLDEMTYTVEAEKGKFIKIRQRGVAGWLAKGDAVPLGEAEAYFTARIRDDANDDFAHGARGFAALERGDLEVGVLDCQDAIRLNPKTPAWHIARAIGLAAQKEWGKAVAGYDEAIRLDPKSARAFNFRGNAWLNQGDRDKAAADFTEAVRLEPTFALAFSNRGSRVVRQAKLRQSHSRLRRNHPP